MSVNQKLVNQLRRQLGMIEANACDLQAGFFYKDSELHLEEIRCLIDRMLQQVQIMSDLVARQERKQGHQV